MISASILNLSHSGVTSNRSVYTLQKAFRRTYFSSGVHIFYCFDQQQLHPSHVPTDGIFAASNTLLTPSWESSLCKDVLADPPDRNGRIHKIWITVSPTESIVEHPWTSWQRPVDVWFWNAGWWEHAEHGRCSRSIPETVYWQVSQFNREDDWKFPKSAGMMMKYILWVQGLIISHQPEVIRNHWIEI